MKISKIAVIDFKNQKILNKKRAEKSNKEPSNSEKLPNLYYAPLNFTRRWTEHKSWGAVFDSKTGNVSFKLFSFPDNKSVGVEVFDKKTGLSNVFEMKQSDKKDGVYESGVIPSEFARRGDKYRFVIKKANGEVIKVKDPYSARQKDFMGYSVLYNHDDYIWHDKNWFKNNPERVSRLAGSKNNLMPVSNLKIYEFNTKTLSEEGTFESAKKELKGIKDMGFNAIEIMPVEATYSFNWGYDGVDKFAPSEHLGGPDGLKSLIDYAHNLGLNVIIDMVPNHIGPDGNSLSVTGPYSKGPNAFGDAFNYEGENSRYVRDFIVNSALNWIDNYHADGLRLDMTKYMDSDYTMKQIAAEVNYHEPEAFLIAEDARSGVAVDKNGSYRDSKRVLHDKRVVNPLEEWEYGWKSKDDYMHLSAIEKIAGNSPNSSLGRLGYDSEWDFIYFHQLKEAIYNNVDLNALFRAMEESQNRVKYVMSHDEIGNYDGTRLLSKLMVPMLSLKENIILNEKDNTRAYQMSELKHKSYDEALEVVKNQKAQLACEELLKQLLTGKFDKYPKSVSGFYWFEPVDEDFINEVLIPLDINVESGICPEKIQEMYLKSYALSKTALALTYSTPGPKMVFQGDEKADITPFRFFREFQSIKDDRKNLYIEKGYDSGVKGMRESTLGKIKYSEYAKEKIEQYKKLTSDLNKIASENKAMSDGHFISEDTLKHHQSKLLATHSVSDDEKNELFTISNFEGVAYPRQDADRYYVQFPKGKWAEILNTDDKKYGGVGYINSKPVNADGTAHIPINIGKYSTLIFKKIG